MRDGKAKFDLRVYLDSQDMTATGILYIDDGKTLDYAKDDKMKYTLLRLMCDAEHIITFEIVADGLGIVNVSKTLEEQDFINEIVYFK